MVRLKGGGRLPEKRGKSGFQFHYGTIKRRLVINKLYAGEAFQFHYGTIKRVPVNPKGESFCISIPLWYD